MREPKRILHVLGGLDLAGAESRIMDIYRKINRDKFQFDFVIHKKEIQRYEPEIIELGGKIYRVPRLSLRSIKVYYKAWNDFFNENQSYQIIHGHMTSTGFIYFFIAKRKNIPIRIAHARSSKKDNIFKFFVVKLTRYFANHYFAVSHNAALSEFGEKRLQNVIIIPNAIDYNLFEFSIGNRILIRNQLNINNKEFLIGHVGRFHQSKNHIFILKILSSLINSKKEENIKLLLIGDGPLKKNIEKKIVSLNLVNHVVLLDSKSDIEKYYSSMDLLVFPSKYEGLPGALLEAQVNGLNCIVSEKITKEVKISERLKFLSIRTGKIIEWTEMISKFKKKIDPLNRSIIINETYNISKTIYKLENLYSELSR